MMIFYLFFFFVCICIDASYATMLSTFIELLLIFIQGENLSFFFSVFEINEAQIQKLNYGVFLSAWFVSMKISPKGIFISRKKRESSEAIVFIV